MQTNLVDHLGDFALIGFSTNANSSLNEKLHRLGISCQTIDFGSSGQLYFYTTYGDVEETEEVLALKLGFTRTPGMSALTTKDLLIQNLLTPQLVQADGMRGNAIVACLSKHSPEFSIYQTIFTPQQLYYTELGGDILCSTNQRCLVNLLDQVALNDEIIPHHLMFQLLPGSLTYYQDIYRLFPGQQLHWKEGQLKVKLVKTLQFADQGPAINRDEAGNADRVYEEIKAVVDFYIDEAEKQGERVTNLLSGGVDSGIIQLIMNGRGPFPEKLPSFSYQVLVPGFQFEAEYAKQAGDLFNTAHTIADIHPSDFPTMISRAIAAVAQPIPGEADACKIMMAEFLAQNDTSRFFFSGQVADALYGMGLARKIAVFNIFRRIPASEPLLKMMSALIKPGSARIADGLQQVVQTLSAINDPKSYQHWPNMVCTYFNLPIARRAFGDEALLGALEQRRDLEKTYLGSQDLTEQLHTIDMLTEGYEPAMYGTQMFLSQKKEQIYPYLDEDVIRNAFSFSPKVRFIKPGLGFMDQNNTKHLLKRVLADRSYGDIAYKRKGASAFDNDLFTMMKHGELQEMTQAIERPAYLSQTDFDNLLKNPDHFLWNLLTLDTFQKQVLKPLQTEVQTI